MPAPAPDETAARPAGAAESASGPVPAHLTGVPAALAEGRARMRMSRLVRWCLVAPLLVLWLVGLVLPVVPGFPFLIAALVLVAPDIPLAHRVVARIQRALPRMRRMVPRHWRRTRRTRR